MNKEEDYVSVIYNEKDRPFTKYPDQLTKYLINRFHLKKGNTILDLGCGRGDFLRGFMKEGLVGFGVDNSNIASEICPNAEITVGDLSEIPYNYQNDSIDYIFSKSVIEHFYYPEEVIKECYRILKPGGVIILMTPDWEVNYKMFFDDYTHRNPFTKTSLNDILLIHEFENIECEKFRQLPFLWNNKWLWSGSSLISFFSPNFLKKKSKLVKFSKEVMLLASATKPIKKRIFYGSNIKK